MIHADIVDIPICFGELLGIASYEDRALGLALKGCTATASPSCVTEISTERSVKDDSVVGKVGIDVATRAIEDRVGSYPSRRVWPTRADV